MPVKPENKARYPRDWPQISLRIRERARQKCEACGLGNGWIGYRDDTGCFIKLADSGKADDHAGRATGYRVFRIVLTVAHLDHQPENCADDNLRAWCQRCHLSYDAQHHAQNAAATRRAGKAVGDLFL